MWTGRGPCARRFGHVVDGDLRHIWWCWFRVLCVLRPTGESPYLNGQQGSQQPLNERQVLLVHCQFEQLTEDSCRREKILSWPSLTEAGSWSWDPSNDGALGAGQPCSHCENAHAHAHWIALYLSDRYNHYWPA